MKPNKITNNFRKSEELSGEDLKDFEGVYQCFASNKYGTALSNKAIIKVASKCAIKKEMSEYNHVIIFFEIANLFCILL